MRRAIFMAAHEMGCPGFGRMWRDVKRNEWADREAVALAESVSLRKMIDFAFTEVPYYREVARALKLAPSDFRTSADLVRLPILTRDTVTESYVPLCPDSGRRMRSETRSTGGTTGTPMKYRLTQHDRFLGAAIMYRGWGYAGYSPGDRMVTLGGRSLGITGNPGLSARLQGAARNVTRLSAFDMSEVALDSYISTINRVKPAFMRGYPGALQVLAHRVLEKRAAVWSPRAVFTTSEQLIPQMRNNIESAFGCPVYDEYGLNDGGVHAQECGAHEGLHIDTERSILQVVNDRGAPITKGVGRIIATTLMNYAMPLLRYDTGDFAEVDAEAVCTCGRPRPLLKRILGRSTDILVTPEGTKVHGWFFLYMFWDLGKGIREYQVIQETARDISIKLVAGVDFDPVVVGKIAEFTKAQSDGWVVRVEVVDSIPRTDGGKIKFIENRLDCVSAVYLHSTGACMSEQVSRGD